MGRWAMVCAAVVLAGVLGTTEGWSRSISSMRCGSKHVNCGDMKARVQQLCGAPTEENSYDRPKFMVIYDSSLGRHRNAQTGVDHMETWTYNRGSSKFVRTLTFENGKLIKIETGGYGW